MARDMVIYCLSPVGYGSNKTRRSRHVGAQLSWESICLTSRGSQVRALLFPPHGLVVQLVRTLACHARGRGFEPHPGRQLLPLQLSRQSRGLKIPVSLVRFRPEAPFICGFSSSGRAPPCQGGGSEFEPRNPLQLKKSLLFLTRVIFLVNDIVLKLTTILI